MNCIYTEAKPEVGNVRFIVCR